MGAFNEIYHAFEEVDRKQERIFNDAADHGYPYNRDNPPKDIKFLIETVKDLKATSQMVKERFTFHDGVTLKIQVPIEIDEGMERGYEYEVTFCKTGKSFSKIRKDCNSFISVSTKFY